jgi:tetratricopeptide (TPR) repeat protein
MAREFKLGLERLKGSENSGDEVSQTIQERAQISDSSLQLVEEIAKKKFAEEDYISCRALYLFLTVMNSKNFDYWQALGITEQELKENENAVVAYENGWLIRQDVIANRLFLAECYVKLQEPQKAFICLQCAKTLMEDQDQVETWSEYIAILEQAITSL